MDIKELETRSNLKINALIQAEEFKIFEWEQKSPYFALTQEMIDNVIKLSKKNIEVLTHIKNKL